MSACIQEGENVVFKRDGSTRVFQIRRNRQVYFEKTKFLVDELFGHPYGSQFEIDRGKLVKIDPSKGNAESDIAGACAESGTDNRNLTDRDDNQKMSKEDIMKMKDEGITGEKIIEELIKNSETFKTKTEFSQAKFLRKKKKKHVMVFTVHRPTPRLVMDIFAKEPAKICNLRPDTLSQLLNYSNVMCGSRVGVVETCQGLVLACVLQRLGGQGKMIQFIPNNSSVVCRQVIDYFGFPQEHLDNMYSYPLDALAELKGDSRCIDRLNETEAMETVSAFDVTSDASNNEKSPVEAGGAEEKTGQKMEEDEEVNGPLQAIEKGGGTVEDKDNDAQKVGEKRPFVSIREQQRKVRTRRQAVAGDMIRDKQLDSLILASKYNPAPILMRLLEFMPPSRPVVVFSQYLEPLVECYTFIKEKHVGLQVKLLETWLREYQMLPSRTHPMMNMSGTGGYLLTFTTSEPSS